MQTGPVNNFTLSVMVAKCSGTQPVDSASVAAIVNGYTATNFSVPLSAVASTPNLYQGEPELVAGCSCEAARAVQAAGAVAGTAARGKLAADCSVLRTCTGCLLLAVGADCGPVSDAASPAGVLDTAITFPDLLSATQDSISFCSANQANIQAGCDASAAGAGRHAGT